VLLDFGAPGQLRSLAGLEHGRTIPLAAVSRSEIPQCSNLLTDPAQFDMLYPVLARGASDAIRSIESPRVHHAAWRRGGRVAKVLEKVGLGHLVEHLDEEWPWDQTLSGGEKQRLAFARHFLHRPDIIVLDEATAALDLPSQVQLMQLLAKEFDGATVVSVGHRPELEAFHSRKIMLQRGRDGAKLVSDRCLIPKSVLPSGRSWVGLLSLRSSDFAHRTIREAHTVAYGPSSDASGKASALRRSRNGTVVASR
jgi:energy-coupling factor transporter ATP-binding protein EcfA2